MSDKDWTLVCTPCKEAGITTTWSDKVELSVIRVHFDLEHPEVETMAFSTEWIGDGPKPAEPVLNRRQKRLQARKDRQRRPSGFQGHR